jgi:hypothetical protein
LQTAADVIVLKAHSAAPWTTNRRIVDAGDNAAHRLVNRSQLRQYIGFVGFQPGQQVGRQSVLRGVDI